MKQRLAGLLFFIICGVSCRASPTFVPPPLSSSTPTITTRTIPSPTQEYQSITPIVLPTTTKALSTQPANPIPSPTSLAQRIIYFVQSGDTLETVANHFHISTSQITSPDPLLTQGLLPYEQVLYLPSYLSKTIKDDFTLPDSEVVYSPSAVDFNIKTYLRLSNGYLSTHREYLKSTGWTSAADIIQRVAIENSINPRLLIALLEYHCRCVTGDIDPDVAEDALLGNIDFRHAGLYRQLSWASSQLAVGHYGWRAGQLDDITFNTGQVIRPAPNLNAGSVALQYYFAQGNDYQSWEKAMDPQNGFMALYESMFGNPWEIALQFEPLLPGDLTQTLMQLPFEEGRSWSYTSGPHSAWETAGALAALDFAPATYNTGCLPTDAWVTAVADGRVVRSEFNLVVLDLDDPITGENDGLEQTGWAVLYMHIAKEGMVPVGTYLKAGERIGQPSCEGGRATGTHVHIARKYNGEWVLADGYLPFNLSGWEAHNGEKPYEGTLTKDGETVVAHWFGSFETRIALPTPTPISP